MPICRKTIYLPDEVIEEAGRPQNGPYNPHIMGSYPQYAMNDPSIALQVQGPYSPPRQQFPMLASQRVRQEAGLGHAWDRYNIKKVSNAKATADEAIYYTGHEDVSMNHQEAAGHEGDSVNHQEAGGCPAGQHALSMSDQELGGSYVSQDNHGMNQQHMGAPYGGEETSSMDQQNMGGFHADPCTQSVNDKDMSDLHNTPPRELDHVLGTVMGVEESNHQAEMNPNSGPSVAQDTTRKGRATRQELRPMPGANDQLNGKLDDNASATTSNNEHEDNGQSDGGHTRGDGGGLSDAPAAQATAAATPASYSIQNPDHKWLNKPTGATRGQDSKGKKPYDPRLRELQKNEDGLYFSCLDEAMSVYTSEARWTPPLLTSPPTRTEKVQLVKRLTAAIMNMEGIADNSNHKFQKWERMVYDPIAMEHVAHRLVTRLLSLHLPGPEQGWRAPILDPTDLAPSRYEENLNFQQRFDAIEDLLWHRKAACGSLLDGSLYDATIASPNLRWNSYLMNQHANKNKKVQIEKGREAMGMKKGKKRRASETETDEEEEGGDATPAERPVKLRCLNPRSVRPTTQSTQVTLPGEDHAEGTEEHDADQQKKYAPLIVALAANNAESATPNAEGTRLTRSRTSGLNKGTPKNAEKGGRNRKSGKSGA
ncbi:uncharacterized protein BDZ99DRAFT_515291 [Mytilinidion resinicola]|uniref:Uncharacterized protein n=1 Tax=Mytilinidion resinicola TaxID=574789 RepID=A0A6A6Z7P2_9PEZI|nr:uncharacterized protein BDZ99DRAFT_515291 [Mytilinidion resinicola]KAF2816713.1 hypothetical protein BDZ99DRAFT_515291 [Mytilinidion resinicola]